MVSKKQILTAVAVLAGVALFVGVYVLVGVTLDALSTPEPRGMACNQISEENVSADPTPYSSLPPDHQETFQRALDEEYTITISKPQYDFFMSHSLVTYQNQTYDCILYIE